MLYFTQWKHHWTFNVSHQKTERAVGDMQDLHRTSRSHIGVRKIKQAIKNEEAVTSQRHRFTDRNVNYTCMHKLFWKLHAKKQPSTSKQASTQKDKRQKKVPRCAFIGSHRIRVGKPWNSLYSKILHQDDSNWKHLSELISTGYVKHRKLSVRTE